MGEGKDVRQQSRYIVGLDLGTTNSAVAVVDTEAESWRVETFSVPQLVAPVTIEARETLPSFHYQPTAAEHTGGALRLPWQSADPAAVVGVAAREQGAVLPGRMIASAKSWLSHGGVDRTAAILPWQGGEGVSQRSPVEVSAAYLEHIRRAWDHLHPQHPLADQDLVLTVPASFDEIARELTVEAAKHAGLRRLVLLEEPQAAFYAWIDRHGEGGGEARPMAPGQRILVCDIGGGTTDLSLIRVEDGGEGRVRFHRLAVGEHLILGGDNLDLTLAHHLEDRLSSSGRLPPRQWSVLVERCRQAKEQLLGEQPPASLTVTLPGGGSRLIGGALAAELGRDEAIELLVEGFLPRVGLDERAGSHASGFREMGLPYAADSAVTRYLAAFLCDHGDPGRAVRPDVVLLNGGFFAGAALRRRLLEVLASWFRTPAEPDWQPRLLANHRLDLAVAHGAAYFGCVRRGKGQRIEAGLARTYYLGADRAEQGGTVTSALCLVPAGLQEGSEVELEDRTFELLIREPVEFPIFTSSVRISDLSGQLIDIDPTEIKALPPIRTVLASGKKKSAERVEVRLGARVTEIGTLELGCREVAGERSWRLQFDVRSAVATDVAAHQGAGERAGFLDAAVVVAAEQLIADSFAGSASPAGLVKRLEEATEASRHEWPPSLLRALWHALIEHQRGRHRSVAHEARWLNLLGFSLRPGYGYAVDDWRMARSWRLSHQAVVHSGNAMCRAEWWVMWRRLAGGLSGGQQKALSEPLLTGVKSLSNSARKSKLKAGSHELAEIWRLLGALEWLNPATKTWLGDTALKEIEMRGAKVLSGALVWTLGRLGSRQPIYGPLNAVLPATTVETWLERLLGLSQPSAEAQFAATQLARHTGDRYRELSAATVEKVARWLEHHRAPSHWSQLVRSGGQLEAAEKRQLFGDSLPRGLVIR